MVRGMEGEIMGHVCLLFYDIPRRKSRQAFRTNTYYYPELLHKDKNEDSLPIPARC